MRDKKIIATRVVNVGTQIRRGVKATASKAVDVGNQVKREAQVAANKMGDAGGQVKQGTQIAVNKMVDASNQVKQGTQAAADKVVEAGDQVIQGAQVAANKVVDAGGQVKQGVQAAANKVADTSRDTFREIVVLAEPNLKKFRQEVADASKKYTDVVGETIDLANEKLRKSAELINPKRRYGNELKKAALAIGAATTGAYTKILAASPGFAELPQTLKTKMVMAGLGGEQGFRLVSAAESFYESSIPDVVKNFGKDAVVDFLDGEHASHIKSVHNDPSLAMKDSNIVWEAAEKNLARGSSNMTGTELAEANIANLVDAAGIVAVEALETAAVAACVGVALEGVVSLGENLIYVYAGERTAKEAALDMAKNMATKGALSAVSGAVISVAIACGAGPVLSSMAPVIVTVGGTIYVIGAVNRISGAYKKTQPGLAISMA
ncbi:MAG: hypothetical protein F4Y81_11050 [Rhodothermaceae bacterium]|nr:hypothetical protein [Rhodothermaceae bacterium]MYG69006.1 hypothetical protein [Rhodothermaceae bacterium]